MTTETETPTPDPTTTLAAWRAVTEGATAATGGLPWVVDPDQPRYVLASRNGGYDGMLIAEILADGRDPQNVEAFVAFLVTARSAMPRLLAFAEAVQAQADQWEEGGEPSPDWWYARGLRAALAEHLGGEGL